MGQVVVSSHISSSLLTMLRSGEDDKGIKRVPSMVGQSQKRQKQEHGSDPEAPQYYPATHLPLAGWMSPCRYCRSWTGSAVSLADGSEVTVCKRCQSKLSDYIQSVVQRHHAQTHAPALNSLSGDTGSPAAGPADSDASSFPDDLHASSSSVPSTASESLFNSAPGSGHSTPRDARHVVPSPGCLHACLLAAQQQQQHEGGETGAGGVYPWRAHASPSSSSTPGSGTPCGPHVTSVTQLLTEYASGAHGLLQRLVAEQQQQQLQQQNLVAQSSLDP